MRNLRSRGPLHRTSVQFASTRLEGDIVSLIDPDRSGAAGQGVVSGVPWIYPKKGRLWRLRAVIGGKSSARRPSPPLSPLCRAGRQGASLHGGQGLTAGELEGFKYRLREVATI